VYRGTQAGNLCLRESHEWKLQKYKFNFETFCDKCEMFTTNEIGMISVKEYKFAKNEFVNYMYYIRLPGAGLAQAVYCLTTGWTTGRSAFDPRQGQRFFPIASLSKPALGPTQPPVQWVPGVLSPGLKRGWGVTLTTHPHLVSRSSMSRSYTSSFPKRLFGV
jgi:hypothetical protein